MHLVRPCAANLDNFRAIHMQHGTMGHLPNRKSLTDVLRFYSCAR